MSRLPLLAAPLVALGAWWAATGTAASDHAAIARAALAPYEALVQRDAGALCSDFRPPALEGALSRSGCRARVARVFAEVPTTVPPPAAIQPLNWTVSEISRVGNQATAVLHYRPDGGTNAIGLELVGARWLMATPARLGVAAVCGGTGDVLSCPPSSRMLVFLLGRLVTPVPIPPAVQRAGGRELREFERGDAVFAQAGCEGCHRLDGQGNAGPGPTLDDIGSRLSERQIVRVLVNPRAPMPSFKNLPAAKFKALVEFLTLLRRQ